MLTYLQEQKGGLVAGLPLVVRAVLAGLVIGVVARAGIDLIRAGLALAYPVGGAV